LSQQYWLKLLYCQGYIAKVNKIKMIIKKFLSLLNPYKTDLPTFTIVGVGPGDPSLITIAAVNAIKKANKSKVAFIIEQEIWALWSTHPTDEKLTARLEEGSQFVRDQNYIKAKDIFTEVINLDQNGLKRGIKELQFFI